MRADDPLLVHDEYSRKLGEQAELCVKLFRERNLFAAEPAAD
jgi:hypothetical protein